MRAAGGVGLAGNQVGFLKRLVVIELPDEDVRVLVNPEIIEREGEREVDEGCLSIPGYRGKVNRSERVKAKWSDLEGNLVELEADGLLAQALEHETDHINGILYVDHLISKDSFWKITDAESSGDNESQEENAGSK
jgi:peptide deformylase